jgi:hypothetical protein
MSLLLPYDCSIGYCRTWSSSALWHDSFDPISWSGAYDMSNLTRVVPLPIIPHPLMLSSICLAATRERCHRLLPMTVVTPTYMPRFHTSQEWGMVQCNEVIASFSLQISSRPSLVKPLGICDLQPQTVMVDASCLSSPLAVPSWLLGCFEYDVLLLRLHRQGQDQIRLSLLAQSNWTVYDIDVRIALQMVSSSNSLSSYCCMKTQSMTDTWPNYLDSPSRMLLAYLLGFGLLAQFSHSSVGDRPNCESSEFRGTHTVAPKSKRQTVTLDQKWSSLELRASIACEQCRF